MINNPGVSLKKTFDPNTLGVQYNPYRAWSDKQINHNVSVWEMTKTAAEVVSWVVLWGRVFKGVRWIYRANKARQALKYSKAVSRFLNGFADEIIAINKTTDGAGLLLNGTPESAINSAMYYESAADQGSAIFRSIYNGHMFLNGNKRSAVAAFQAFAEQFGL